MKSRKLLFPFVFLVIFGLLAGCATPAPVMDLPQTFTTFDKSLTFDYPEGWKTSELPDGSIVSVSRDELMIDPNGFTSGDCGVVMAVLDNSTIENFGKEDPDYGSIVKSSPPNSNELLRYIGKMILGEEPDQVENLKINQNGAAQFAVPEGSQAFSNGSIVMVVIEAGEDNFIFYQAVSAKGEMETCEDTYLAIANSIRYTAIEETPSP